MLIVNRVGRPLDQIQVDVDAGLANLASVGRPVLANPDLVSRLKHSYPLNEPNPNTFYGGGELGYTDYPTFSA
jgi:2,4-dienoyl-CoA reductase-like NADH-dependent reductase (Old Yellow Enzyme family)